jgi:hypothetical protein
VGGEAAQAAAADVIADAGEYCSVVGDVVAHGFSSLWGGIAPLVRHYPGYW